jgi:hypothetical protein
MAVLTQEIEIVSPRPGDVFCFVFGLITHVPRRLEKLRRSCFSLLGKF